MDAVIPMTNPHFLAAIETVVRAWLDAGRADLAGIVAATMTDHLRDPTVTRHLQASAALIDAWVSGSAPAADRAASLAAELPAPWWEERARAAVS